MYQLAVIGNPIGHSLSPTIWQYFAQECKIELNYTKICAPLDSFEQIVADFFANAGLALNITAPFKARAYQIANLHQKQAVSAKTANLLIKQGDKLFAANTDGAGLVLDLAQNAPKFKNKNILIIGNGSVVHSVLAEIEGLQPQRIDLLMRNWDNLEQFSVLHEVSEFNPEISYDLVLNTTINSPENYLFTQIKYLNDDSVVYDMDYRSMNTLFLQTMQKINAKISKFNGLGMLVAQAGIGFDLVFGLKPNTQKVFNLLLEQMNG